MSFSLKLNVLEDAEMGDFVMKGMSVNVQMDCMVLTVKKVIKKSSSVLFCTLFIQQKEAKQSLLSKILFWRNFWIWLGGFLKLKLNT